MKKPDAITAVIPALNEQDTIAWVVNEAFKCPLIDEVLVVNNGSTDDTAKLAEAAGATVILEQEPGQGYALRTGYKKAKNDWVVKLDADLSRFSDTLIQSLRDEVGPGVGLVKGLWHDAHDNMPMTRLMVRPAIAIMFPGLSHIDAINSGLFLFNRSLIAVSELTPGYGADLDIILRIHTAGWNTAEVDIGEIAHDPRNLQHYNNMAETLLRFLIERHEQAAQNNIIVVTDSADDIITCCFGAVAKKLRSGGQVVAYMNHCDGYAADLLRKNLADYPTFSIQPLDKIDGINVFPGRQHTTIITSYFNHVADSDDPLIRAALGVQSRCNKRDEVASLLMMPVRQNSQVVTEFRPDVRVDIRDEVSLKKLIQDELGEENKIAAELIVDNRELHKVWRGQFHRESIETFQAFDHKDISPPLITL